MTTWMAPGLVRPRRFIMAIIVITLLAAAPLLVHHQLGVSLLWQYERLQDYKKEVRYRSVRYEEIFSSDSNKFGNVIDNKFGDVIGDIIPVSMSPDIDRRGKFQRAQVKKYCMMYNSPDALPNNYSVIKESLQHIILDKRHKILYCSAPKLASVNMKYLFAALNNATYSPNIRDTHPMGSYRLLNETEQRRHHILNDYFKFVMTRNPLERVLSGYRSKIEHSITINLSNKFDQPKIEMIKAGRPKVYSQWEESGRTIKVFPTFNEFIRYLNSHSYYELDEHIRPLLYICHPCVYQYDFYANLKLMPEELFRILDKFNIPHDTFKDQPAQHDTRSLMSKYYATLSEEEKKMVYKFVHQELEFYYHIYPEERDMHIPLIGHFK